MGALTGGDAGRGGGAPGLLLQSHHGDDVLLPRLQSRLVEGGDVAGELGDHPSFIVLGGGGEGEAEKATEVTGREGGPLLLNRALKSGATPLPAERAASAWGQGPPQQARGGAPSLRRLGRWRK